MRIVSGQPAMLLMLMFTNVLYVSYNIYRDAGRQTLVRSKELQRPVQRVPPMQAQQLNSTVAPQHGMYNAFSTLKKKCSDGPCQQLEQVLCRLSNFNPKLKLVKKS